MLMYYAHPMSYYGTPEEFADMKLIKEAGWTPIQPNASAFDDGVKREKAAGRGGMEPFLAAVRASDAIAVRAFRDGKLGAGVAGELLQAIIFGKEVYELAPGPSGTQRLAKVYNPRGLLTGVLTVDETRRRIREGVL